MRTHSTTFRNKAAQALGLSILRDWLFATGNKARLAAIRKRSWDAIILGLTAIFLLAPASGLAEARFPHPDFDTQYDRPSTSAPEASASAIEYLDLLLLAVALGLATYLMHKRRSRRGIFVLMLLCLAYFGFWRQGCICPIGSIQNVTAGLADSGYTVSLFVLGFFALPIISALFSGRTFCSSVCPLGAIQDVVVVKPIKLPWQVSRTLRVIPYVYLGAAVLLATTGSAFIICRLDPFVSFFRLSGSLGLLVLGAVFLLIGVFIARPYCRFLCPYGVILGWASSFSKHHLRITPAECIQCRLCEDACPFDAIRKPVSTDLPEDRGTAKRRLILVLALLPVITILCGWLGSLLQGPISRLDNTVVLAEQVYAENTGQTQATTLRSEAFRQRGERPEQLYAQARDIGKRIKTGGWIFGGFVGFSIGCGLVKFSTRRTRLDYEADRMECLGCGRCFAYCPVET